MTNKKMSVEEIIINDYETVTAISKETHLKISRYYSSVHPFTGGLIFRDYITNKSFPEQYAYGVIVTQNYLELQ